MRLHKGTIFWLLAMTALVGYLIVDFVPRLVHNYRELADDAGAEWANTYLGVVLMSAGAALGLVAWTLWLLRRASQRREQRRAMAQRPIGELSAHEMAAEITEQLDAAKALAGDDSLPTELRASIDEEIVAAETKRECQKLEIVAFGTISSGKSSLLNLLAGRELFRTDPKGGTTSTRNEIPWPNRDRVVLVDTPGLAEIDGQAREHLAKQAAADADLVLFVIDGPLKDFEHRLLAQLSKMEKRVLVCINKEDWFREDEKPLLIGQVVEQCDGLAKAEDVVLVRACPAKRVRIRILPDGREAEEQSEVEPDITRLCARMMQVVDRDGRDLLLANLLLQCRSLVSDARSKVQAELDERARQIVERTMWQASTAAAIAPLPVIDVMASMAFNTKMVVELARVYRQEMDLESAGRLIGELGKNLVAILGTSAAAPALGTAIASMLKSVPGIGTLSGGLLQGLVQALMTRWIGRVFILYFREAATTPANWAEVARRQWSEVTRPTDLLQLARQGAQRWLQGPGHE